MGDIEIIFVYEDDSFEKEDWSGTTLTQTDLSNLMFDYANQGFHKVKDSFRYINMSMVKLFYAYDRKTGEIVKCH